jgi:hypothetical protein
MLSVFILSVALFINMLSVFMLNVILLSVVAPIFSASKRVGSEHSQEY